MNCPKCHENVGEDQFAFSDPIETCGADEQVIDAHRILSIECESCGCFEVMVDAFSNRIRGPVRGPFRGSARIERVRSAIPAVRQEVQAA